MRCNWLRKLSTIAASSGILAISGCYSMNGYVMNASGQGYYQQGNYAMAAQEFQTALASKPNNPDYMANLAKAKMKMGDAAGAEQLYRQALTTSPSHQPSYHGYAELLTAQGRQPDAMKMLNTWAATQPYIAESHVELAWLQREMGQKDAAARSLQTALQVNPNHATALAHLGQYYQDSGQTDQAMAMYQQSLQSDWNQPEVQSRLASAASTVGAGHPMGEIAMSRGVHPHSIPRQQLTLGAQAPSMQMAQMPPMQPHVAYQQPLQAAGPQQYAGVQPTLPQPMMPPVQSATSPMRVPSMFAAGAGTISDVTTVPAAPSVAIPSPTPDPAFAQPPVNSSRPINPVTSVSQSTTTNADDLPEVDAF